MYFWLYHRVRIFGYQIIYFIILCQYLGIKLDRLNEKVINMHKKNQFFGIRKILYSYDAFYREINEYNTTYWSQFLFIVWHLFGHVIVLMTFIVIFTNINWTMKINMGYAVFIMIILMNFINLMACSVYSKANRTYIILNSFITNCLYVSRFIKIARLPDKMNVLSFTERMSKQKFGFSCWMLFMINYFKYYEVT